MSIRTCMRKCMPNGCALYVPQLAACLQWVVWLIVCLGVMLHSVTARSCSNSWNESGSAMRVCPACSGMLCLCNDPAFTPSDTELLPRCNGRQIPWIVSTVYIAYEQVEQPQRYQLSELLALLCGARA
jgi:hypothetical protein